MSYIALFKNQGDIFIMLNKDNQVVGFETLREGLGYFEGGYNANHARNHEASMSACIHFLTFQPKIAKIKDSEIMKYVGEKPTLYRISNVSGQFAGVKLLEKFNNLYEKAESPKLI